MDQMFVEEGPAAAPELSIADLLLRRDPGELLRGCCKADPKEITPNNTDSHGKVKMCLFLPYS